jgi:hypothetical protein
MRILKEVIRKLEGMNPNDEYFTFSKEERKKICSVLWDEVYGDIYLKSLQGKTIEKPLTIQYNILSYLMELLENFKEHESYELCEVVNTLINITENKIQQIERYYATTEKKTRGE